MYTNPSDFYMSLMKDEEASPKLVELWKKADDQWVTTPRLTAPEQQTPFTNGSKVAQEAVHPQLLQCSVWLMELDFAQKFRTSIAEGVPA